MEQNIYEPKTKCLIQYNTGNKLLTSAVISGRETDGLIGRKMLHLIRTVWILAWEKAAYNSPVIAFFSDVNKYTQCCQLVDDLFQA
jgi:hypothetical protein